MTRYERQIAVPEIGTNGQRQLSDARVLIVGVGGLGCPAALYLAGAGIGTLGLIDGDTVSLSNLHRQILFSASDAGTRKVQAARLALSDFNPQINIQIHDEYLDSQNSSKIFSHYDLILDGTDSFDTKFLINDTCLKLNLPWIYASASYWDGQTAFFAANDSESACYRCLQPSHPTAEIKNCGETGVVGPVVGMIGTLQALQAVQFFLSREDFHKAMGVLHVFDGLNLKWMKILIPKNKKCVSCNERLRESLSNAEVSPGGDTNVSTLVEAAELMKNGKKILGEYTFLDVREIEEWSKGHIEGALHWPLHKLQKNSFPDFILQQKILVYCHSGKRSQVAARLLIEKGFQSVSELRGGFSAWPGSL